MTIFSIRHNGTPILSINSPDPDWAWAVYEEYLRSLFCQPSDFGAYELKWEGKDDA